MFTERLYMALDVGQNVATNVLVMLFFPMVFAVMFI